MASVEANGVRYAYRRFGKAGGETPSTVAEMTRDCLSLCRALSLKAIHGVGFLLGAMIAHSS